MDTLIKYIRAQVAKGHEVEAITSALKEAGHSQSDIDAAMKEALRDLPSKPDASKQPPAHKHFDLVSALLYLGSILILIAVIVVIYSQWENVGPVGRVFFLGIPMALLFAIAAVTMKDSKYQEVSEVTFVTASLILPFFFGTLLYQFKIIPEINALLFGVSALLAFFFYAFIEFVGRREQYSILSVATFWTSYFSFIIHWQVNTQIILWLTLVIAILLVGFGLFLLKRQASYGGAYITIGTFGIVTLLPLATLHSLNINMELEWETNMAIFSLFGLPYLAIVSAYNTLSKITRQSVFYILKRFIEEIIPFVLIVPYLLIGSSQHWALYVVVLVSTILIVLSFKVRIKTLLWVSSAGLIIGLIMLTNLWFDFASIAWPILLFLAGFLSIGIAFGLRNMNLFQKASTHPPMLLGIGEDPDFKETSQTIAERKQQDKAIIFAIVLIVILFFAITATIDHLSYNRNKSQVTTPPPPVTREHSINEPQTPRNNVTMEDLYGRMIEFQLNGQTPALITIQDYYTDRKTTFIQFDNLQVYDRTGGSIEPNTLSLNQIILIRYQGNTVYEIYVLPEEMAEADTN